RFGEPKAIMVGFEYPNEVYSRRHGPEGYTNYESFRDWLRDEFLFRCVYCLHREQWYHRSTTFTLDHFTPVTVDDDGMCEYTNLLYACATCNNAKRAIIGIPDPCKIRFSRCLRINDDGYVQALNDDGKKLEAALRLNSKNNLTHRSRWMRTLKSLSANDPEL